MVDEKTVKKVAETARVSLTKTELKEISEDLNSILNAFKDLEHLKMGKNVKPSFQPLEIKDVTRKDKTEQGLTQEEALSNTRQKERGYFKGPKAV